MLTLNRRVFLGTAAAACAGTITKAQALPPVPIVDCHIHLFDQTRPQGAPYAGTKGNRVPSLPARYRKLAAPLGIVGAIEIEASPWIEDNLWVLEIEEKAPIMLGTMGNLQPEKPEFREYLERYHRNKLFLGIRYGNLWGYSLVNEIQNPVFIEGLKLIRQADLAFETANPQPDLMDAVLKMSDRVPGLRIVIDHVPAMLRGLDRNTRIAVEANMKELAKRAAVFVKVSEIMQMTDDKPILDSTVYKPTLDYLFDTFGENKLIFGSDWPNGAAANNLPAVLKIVQNYFNAKGRGIAEKFFWRNSTAAYKWIRRDPSQPQALS
jgi:L-fuconolactonase